MKKMILILAVLLAVSGVTMAQDTIRYPDPRYMYNPFTIDSISGSVVDWGLSLWHYYQDSSVSTDIWGSSNCMYQGYDDPNPVPEGWVLIYNPLTERYYWTPPGLKPTLGRYYAEYIAKEQTLIYGIAATTGDTGWYASGRILDSIYTLGELYNVGWLKDTNFNLYAYLFRKTGGEIYCVDSAKWIRHNNPYNYFEYSQYPRPGFEQFFEPTYLTRSYEFYFDRPVSVIDTFLIGVRFPYADSLAIMYAYWYNLSIPNSEDNAKVYHHFYHIGVPWYKEDYCSQLSPYSGSSWGGFFPILTPRDTTRCDPVWDLQMTNATDTSVTLEWDGGNATQWEVEYAEADGMTAYSVVTTTRVTLTGLRPTTTYLAHVRAWCARDTAYGGWTPFIEARTTAHQPDTDTVQNPDTVSIDAVGLFTRLMPNPASGMVTVQSSYSLSHVAVYDVQGHLVLEQKAAGTAATFDVGSLPKGVYVVSVRTTAGTTTKRLIVE